MLAVQTDFPGNGNPHRLLPEVLKVKRFGHQNA
jgi:hypothetical protein